MASGASVPPATAPQGRVALFALGGTISMSGDGRGGVVPRLSGTQLLAGLGGLEDIEIEVHDIEAMPSADVTFADILDVIEAAGAAVTAGARGIVLTQGTDTLEETAFLIDCLWPHAAPFVVTGAMRNPTLPGADGPANLMAALRVAVAEATRDLGVLVVFGDEIHAARHVRKTHAVSIATFASPDLGPIGHVVEDFVRLLAWVPRLSPIAVASARDVTATKIALYTATMDDGGGHLENLRDHGYRGLVVAGFGAGHVSGAAAEVLGTLAAGIPVVYTSRCGAGSVLRDTYGAVGSERDLLRRGLLSGGFVHPYKARILLRLLVASGASTSDITVAFAALG